MDKDWLSTGEVASIMGVSRQHVVDLCDSGQLPCTRIGTHRRIRRTDVDRLLDPKLTFEQEKSLWLHRAVLGALTLDPEKVIQTAIKNIARWSTSQRPDGMTMHYLNQWKQIIDSGIDVLMTTLVGTDERSSELRQNSPFAGVLSDVQRQKVLRSFRDYWHAKELAS